MSASPRTPDEPRKPVTLTTLVVPGAMLMIIAAIVIGSGLLETGLF